MIKHKFCILFLIFFNVGYIFSAQASPVSLVSPALVKLPIEKIPQLTVEDADSATADWEAGSKSQLKLALTRQIAKCKLGNLSETWTFGTRRVTKNEWCVKPALWMLSKIETVTSLHELYTLAAKELEWYQSTGQTGKNDVLFTGYFYPEIKVKKIKDKTFIYPIYKMPADLKKPYFTRAQIVAGALNGRGLELGYASNPVDPYLLEVQGSGLLEFIDAQGNVVSKTIANFAATNGQPYVSLGKLMRAAGIDESYISMQGIHRYFSEHPDQWQKFSNQNPSFVFFKPAAAGPYGAGGVILTPKHSIAVDPAYFPMGALAMVQTDRPSRIENEQATQWKPFAQFMVAQDVGGAIKSPGRVDLYYGSGEYAKVAAGQTENLGSLYFMLMPPASN